VSAARANMRMKLPDFGMSLSPPLGFAAKVRPALRGMGYGPVPKWLRSGDLP
jgi:hypothetical protein